MTAPRPTGRTQAGDDEAALVVDTTEIRWFFPGPLPSHVRQWFAGTTGSVEERRDTYLLGGRVDIGVKYRGGTLLELKVRQASGRRTDLGAGLSGRLETWRKWSGGDGVVEIPVAARWIDVDKLIVKRRFLLDGSETAFSADQEDGPACDVEVAVVTVGSSVTWTLAFAAFGPTPDHHPAVLAAWRALGETTPAPSADFGTARAMGYPEWLARTFAQHADLGTLRCGVTT